MVLVRCVAVLVIFLQVSIIFLHIYHTYLPQYLSIFMIVCIRAPYLVLLYFVVLNNLFHLRLVISIIQYVSCLGIYLITSMERNVLYDLYFILLILSIPIYAG